MTTGTDDSGDKSAQTQDPGAAGDLPGCAPGCACREPAAGKDTKKIKAAISLAVLAAVVGILLFKATSAQPKPSLAGTNGFSHQFAATPRGPVTTSAEQQGGRGASLSAIAELNTVASRLDLVFLVIPGKDNAPTARETDAALTAVERTLNAKGLSTGIYTLQTASPDYPDVAAKVTAPGVAVLAKSGGIGFASGGISETSLMQAYVSSTRGGGCCPPGGGNAGVPCK